MIIGLRLMDDGTITIWGETDGLDRGHFLNEIARGASFCGLAYEELIQYAWIETDVAGNFIKGDKHGPIYPALPVEIPDFLKRRS